MMPVSHGFSASTFSVTAKEIDGSERKARDTVLGLTCRTAAISAMEHLLFFLISSILPIKRLS